MYPSRVCAGQMDRHALGNEARIDDLRDLRVRERGQEHAEVSAARQLRQRLAPDVAVFAKTFNDGPPRQQLT